MAGEAEKDEGEEVAGEEWWEWLHLVTVARGRAPSFVSSDLSFFSLKSTFITTSCQPHVWSKLCNSPSNSSSSAVHLWWLLSSVQWVVSGCGWGRGLSPGRLLPSFCQLVFRRVMMVPKRKTTLRGPTSP